MKSNIKPIRTMKLLLATLLVVLSQHVAQAAGLAAPDAGSIMQQVQPVKPLAPAPTGTGLKIEREGAGQMPPTAPFEVKTIQFSGNTLFDTATLHALVADAEGKSLTLAQLDEQAAKITDYYRNHDYPLTRAFIPAQTIEVGIVRIEVMETRYGRIKLDNHSQVKDALLESILAPIQGGQDIRQTPLDRSLLLLSDIPGIVPNSILKPGDTVGTSDLLVEAETGQVVSSNAVLDNYGNRYTGRARAGLTANYNNPLHHGDGVSFNGVTSGRGMNYGRISYESLLNGSGTRMGAAFSTMHYILGDTLASLNGHGTAQAASLWAKHPFLRGQSVNLYGQLQYDRKQLRDHIEAAAIHTDRHLNNWTVSLTGDNRDTFFSNGVNTWSLGMTSGREGFDDTAAQHADATTAKTQGRFTKWNANIARLQSLSPQNALYFVLAAQGANANLDSSEKMTAGGPNTVRAYDMGVLSGDTGYLFTAEFRRDLKLVGHGQWQAVAFVDNEHVTVNKTVWVSGPNNATLRGAGLGLNWVGANQWSAKACAAKRIGSTPTLLGSVASARAWIEVGKGF